MSLTPQVETFIKAHAVQTFKVPLRHCPDCGRSLRAVALLAMGDEAFWALKCKRHPEQDFGVRAEQ